jgi:DUF1680 family protein
MTHRPLRLRLALLCSFVLPAAAGARQDPPLDGKPGGDAQEPTREGVNEDAPAKKRHPVPRMPDLLFDDGAAPAHLAGGFWGERLELVRAALLPALLDRLESEGALASFRAAQGDGAARHSGRIDDDAAVYAAIEAAGWALLDRRDAALEGRVAALVGTVIAAQAEDGYLNTAVQSAGGERWKDLRDGGELAALGALIDAGLVWRRATGDARLEAAGLRAAELVDREFGPDARVDPAGDPGIELALYHLAKSTGDARWSALGFWFLGQRGSASGRLGYGAEYQDLDPMPEQREGRGDADRQLGFDRAAAYLAHDANQWLWFEALEQQWRDLVLGKLDVTGGLALAADGASFGAAHRQGLEGMATDLEASIALAEFCRAMFEVSWQSKYLDVEERVLYDAALAALAPDGRSAAALVPLGARPGASARPAGLLATARLARLVAAVPQHLSAGYEVADARGIFVSGYASGTSRVTLGPNPASPDPLEVELVQETSYPWDGRVRITVNPAREERFHLHLRLPGWSAGDAVFVRTPEGDVDWTRQVGTLPAHVLTWDGSWRALERAWKPGDVVELVLPMKPRRAYADARAVAALGRVALQRGPLVYAIRDAENDGRARQIVLTSRATLSDAPGDGLAGGAVVLRADALALVEKGGARALEKMPVTAVPYFAAFAGASEQRGSVVTWVPDSMELAELPGEVALRISGGVLRASPVASRADLAALVDGELPRGSADPMAPRFAFGASPERRAWLQLEWQNARTVDGVSIYWAREGGSALPLGWRILADDGSAGGALWKPVELAPGSRCEVAADRYCSARFAPLVAKALRIEIDAAPAAPPALAECRVEIPAAPGR